MNECVEEEEEGESGEKERKKAKEEPARWGPHQSASSASSSGRSLAIPATQVDSTLRISVL